MMRTYAPELLRPRSGGALAIHSSGTSLRYATPADLTAIDALRKKDGSSLGFIPMAVYESNAARAFIANRDRWRTQQLLVCEDNDDLTGFVFASYAEQHAEIVQICIRQDARRMERALFLADYVEGVAARAGRTIVRARVAADIEAVLFWQAAGFQVVSTTVSTFLNQREAASRRSIHIFEKITTRHDALQPLLFAAVAR